METNLSARNEWAAAGNTWVPPQRREHGRAPDHASAQTLQRFVGVGRLERAPAGPSPETPHHRGESGWRRIGPPVAAILGRPG
jgi:hypothetical protein